MTVATFQMLCFLRTATAADGFLSIVVPPFSVVHVTIPGA